jgi:uncharacterized protein YegP (UPF0339 family)
MKFIIHKSKDHQFFYELKASNGKTMLVSETMKRRRSCIEAIHSIMNKAASASIEA